tara:strand:+ start:1279 stop:2178 length:900 start_codon:yes stop_codon:yes gene_type:complete
MTTAVKKRMRQSLLGTAHSCQYRLNYVLDPNVPYTTGVVRALGTAIHAGHEAYYANRQETGDVVSSPDQVQEWKNAAFRSFDSELSKVEGVVFDWVYQPKTARKEYLRLDRSKAKEMIGRSIDLYHDKEYYWDEDHQVLAVEWDFNLPLEGFEDWDLSGTLDLLLRHIPTGNIKCVDHKNVKAPPAKNKYAAHKTPQAAFYLHAVSSWLQELGIETQEAPTFWYDVLAFDGSGFWRFEEVRDQQQIAVTISQAEMLATLIDKDGPYLPNTESFLCSESYCDFWHMCPFGDTLHKQPTSK